MFNNFLKMLTSFESDSCLLEHHPEHLLFLGPALECCKHVIRSRVASAWDWCGRGGWVGEGGLMVARGRPLLDSCGMTSGKEN